MPSGGAASSRDDEVAAELGLTLIGGMSMATLLTLLVVPIFYTLFDDARLAVGRLLHRIVDRPAAAGTGDSVVRAGPSI